MTRHVDRPGIVLANAKHLESNAGANAPGATFRHEITPAGESGFSEFDESLFTLCGLKGADVVADATVLFNAIHPDDVANFEHALAPDDDDTGNRRFEIRILGPDGTIMVAVVSARLMEFDGEEAIFGSLYDITDTKRAEQEIKASERRL